eukprot:12424524-Alexandrium_andersonii.AAC.1
MAIRVQGLLKPRVTWHAISDRSNPRAKHVGRESGNSRGQGDNKDERCLTITGLSSTRLSLRHEDIADQGKTSMCCAG